MRQVAPWWLREKDRLLLAMDAVVALLMAVPAVLGVLEPLDPAVSPTFHGWFHTLGLLAALSFSLPLGLRRRWPRAIYLIVLAATMTADVIEVSSGASAAAAWVLYIVVRERTPRESLGWLAAGLASVVVILLVSRFLQLHVMPNQYGWTQAALGAAFFLLAWVLGYMARRHKEMQDAIAAEARHRDRVEARLHLAREVHDVVAHNLSVITVKAGVALHVAERRPEEAVETLRVIERTGRTALAEVRQLVETLRNDVPATGLAALPELVDSAAGAGVTVTVHRDLPPLPQGLESSVFRIVQEAVTNTVKHAAPAGCQVTLTHDEKNVFIEVVDDGDARREPLPGGHGLTGVRERVEAYGGELSAGPAQKGWRLAATLPYEEST